MLERLWLSVALASATSLSGLACDVSEAAPSLPAPAKRDAGVPTDAAVIDAAALDAGIDATTPGDASVDAQPPLIDGGVRRRRPRPPRDAGVVIDAGVPPVDAGAPPVDAAVIDAPLLPDAAIVDGPPLDARDILRDSGEAPPINDASILRDF
jgi:hypothetical protein